MQEKLVDVTFEPSTYDFEVIEGSTDLKSWNIVKINENGMTLKFEFASPNLLSYSIHERDEIELAVNLTTVVEGDGSRLWGKYVK